MQLKRGAVWKDLKRVICSTRQAERLADEKPERREARLQQMRDRQAERLADESPESREGKSKTEFHTGSCLNKDLCSWLQ